MISCESAVGCNNPAALSVSLLVPTGEVIDSDTGSAPVLRPAMSKLLCNLCAFGAGVGSMLVSALGAHLDVEAIVEPESADPLTAAKSWHDWQAEGPWTAADAARLHAAQEGE